MDSGQVFGQAEIDGRTGYVCITVDHYSLSFSWVGILRRKRD